MTSVLCIILCIIFVALAIIHFNWAMGGKWGFDKALPTDENGKRVLNPRKIDSVIVGAGLTLFGLFYLLQLDLLEYNAPSWIIKYGKWIVPAIFMFRAIGDFKYVGFFKRIQSTEFACLDSRLYSPLCLTIAIIGISIALL